MDQIEEEDSTELSQIWRVIWRTAFLKLSVHSHRGHCDDYHPRNLLDGNGTDTYYLSDGNKPAVGDWIIFEIENRYNVIPKTVIIRNNRIDSGIKSIELSVGQKADVGFKRLAVIKGIHRKNEEPQYFRLDHSDVLSAKFMKLKILENWGWHWNFFYSFEVLGLRCD